MCANENSSPPLIDPLTALGAMMVLMLQSPLHRRWRIWDIEFNIGSALRTGQYRLYKNERGEFCAFVTWAFLDEKNHQSMLEKGELLSNADWQSGEYMWFIDYVAPHGNTAVIVRDMQWHVFPHQQYFYAVRHNEDGGIRKITRWCCYRAKKPSK
ncbi:toxin-activating lysine-acyltransferase [Bartonella vinsonii]|uniref:RTX toxin-activating lysine-acyltransferase n=1 Tax=Bartonella vinsonii TaxID=33047 RepID=A0A448V5N8_BARVI|nr:toxin-activating lysine-acyltransferase [Bartonella vinsonii]VEJ45084.1 Hemolysin-activating lysine-acyltransferase hlyC [Bartonella vinsonii]